MTFLFAHISWMSEYSGKSTEDIFSTHGWVVEKNEAGERSNFKPTNGEMRGYFPVAENEDIEKSGKLDLQRLGGDKKSDFLDSITVIWFANKPPIGNKAYIVGWYRDARVFRRKRPGGVGGYRTVCAIENATLIPEEFRDFEVPRSQSKIGQALGFGYGQSSVWYADKDTDEFLKNVQMYIDTYDSNIGSNGRSSKPSDAIDDLDSFILGNDNPTRSTYTTQYIVRDNRIRRVVVERAKGRCEHCGELGFPMLNGGHFVEAHHIISLAKQGPDTLDNVIALCPNHHREAHFGADSEQLERQFLAKLAQIQGN